MTREPTQPIDPAGPADAAAGPTLPGREVATGHPPLRGRVISHYRVECELGRGGMGVVYRAVDLRLKRPVALKFLAPELTHDAKAKARFAREAQAASALDHPNICTIHDIDETDDGQMFIAMACYEGRDLRTRLRNGRPSIDEAVDIARQVAAGLARVHQRGIVHRDLKPANVFVLEDGLVKIVDFGLAKLASDVRITRTGITLGTVSYMSPEQTGIGQVDHRSDIWSLGVVLYEMLTGELPFRGDCPDAVIHSIRHDQPRPPSAVHPPVDSALDRSVLRCLEKKPEARYQDAGAILADLPGGLGPRGPARSARARRSLGVAAIAALVVAGAVGLWAWLNPGRVRVAAPSAALLTDVRQVTTCGTAVCPLWSGDGQDLVYRDETGLQVVAVDGSNARPLEVEIAYAVPWNTTPDGQSILVNGRDPTTLRPKIWLVPFTGGSADLLVESAVYGDIHPDGRQILYVSETDEPGLRDGIWCRDLITGEEQRILTNTGPGTAVYKPQWSPDGQQIAFIRWQGGGHELWVCRSDGSDERKIDMGPMHVGGHFCWTRDGRAVVAAGNLYGLFSIWRIPIDGSDPIRLTEATEYTYHASLSPDASALAFTRGRDLSRIRIYPVDGGAATDPLDQSVAVRMPVFSADGSRLYYQALINGNWQVWTADASGASAPRRLVADPRTSCEQPAVSGPRELYYVESDLAATTVFGDIEWGNRLCRYDIENGRHEPVSQAGSRVARVVGDHSGQRGLLLGVREHGLEWSLHHLDRRGSLHELARDSDTFSFQDFTWGRRDGEVLVAHLIGIDPDGGSAVSAIDQASGERQLLFAVADLGLPGLEPRGPVRFLRMADDRRHLFLALLNGTDGTVWIVRYDCATGEAQRVATLAEEGELLSLDVAPDGSRVAVSIHRSRADVFVANLRSPGAL